jgi:hypothetical protein
LGVIKLTPYALLGDPGAFARKKTNKLSPRRKARRGVKAKNNTNIEVLGGLGAFAREKKYNLAETQRKLCCLQPGCSIEVSEACDELFAFHFFQATYCSSLTSVLSQ